MDKFIVTTITIIIIIIMVIIIIIIIINSKNDKDNNSNNSHHHHHHRLHHHHRIQRRNSRCRREPSPTRTLKPPKAQSCSNHTNSPPLVVNLLSSAVSLVKNLCWGVPLFCLVEMIEIRKWNSCVTVCRLMVNESHRDGLRARGGVVMSPSVAVLSMAGVQYKG